MVQWSSKGAGYRLATASRPLSYRFTTTLPTAFLPLSQRFPLTPPNHDIVQSKHHGVGTTELWCNGQATVPATVWLPLHYHFPTASLPLSLPLHYRFPLIPLLHDIVQFMHYGVRKTAL